MLNLLTKKSPETSRRRQKGAAMLETALVLMTVVGMIIFVLDMGRMLLTQQFITERARVTIRAAVVNNWTADATANFLCYNSTTAPGGDNTTPGYLGLKPSYVSYQTLGTSTAPDYRLQLTVSGVPMLTWIPFISGSYSAAPITVTMPAQSLGATS